MTHPTPLHDRADALLRLLNRSERLEALPRTGWLACGITPCESIAAHIYHVTLIALWLADHMEEDVNAELVMRIALVHDIGESLMTDLPSPVKQFVGKDMIRDAEHRAAERVLEDTDPRWMESFSSYEQLDCIEARVVKAADKIQMLAKALQYERQQRGDTQRFWANGTPDDFQIPLVRAIFERLRSHHEQGSWFASDFD